MSKSAELLGLSQPNLSRAVTMIEENMGLKIFDRSVRPLRLTEFGKELIPYIITHIHSHTALVDFVEHYKQSSVGKVRLQAPTGQLLFISKYLVPKLQRLHPEIKIELLTNNLSESEYSEGTSFNPGCDILFTHALPKNEDLVAVKVVSMKANVYGSYALIERSKIRSLNDYCHQPCILFYSFMDEQVNTWSFMDRQDNKEVSIFINGNYVCDNACTAIELAKAGMGFLYAPDILIQEMGGNEQLFPTLPERYSSSMTNFMIYHRRSHQPYRVEVVIRLLNEIIAEVISDFDDRDHNTWL
jgi:DNA-binding transcriptional LysR family regulator